MFRLVFTLLILMAAGYGGLAFYYGATEPCDMLAQEITNQQADAAERMLGADSDDLSDRDGMLAGLNRMSTDRMSQQECVDDLWRAWFDDEISRVLPTGC